MAADDAIVYPGQPGKAHMHTFYGNDSTNAFSTFQTLMNSGATCARNFQIPDRSGYWIPTLYKDGKPVNGPKFSLELAVYYKRGGGPAGVPVNQAFPQGLRMIAGDMHATKPQANVWFKCMNSVDTGRQRLLQQSFPSCSSEESLIAGVQFPDCWNGKTLDSADHKSHMAFSSGDRGTCPSTHPVKVPKIFMEAKYPNVNGPGSSLRFSSGGAYSFHGDVMSAWDPKAFAGLVNKCINVNYDCNPLIFDNIDLGGVTQAQIDAQTRLIRQTPRATSPTATATATTASPVPKPTPTLSTPTASHNHSSTPTNATTAPGSPTTTTPPAHHHPTPTTTSPANGSTAPPAHHHPTPTTTSPANGSTVSVTNPAAHSKVRAGTTIAASTSGAAATKVEFWVDGQLVNIDTRPRWKYRWVGAPLGDHAVQAKAYFANGTTVMSAPVHVTVVKGKAWWRHLLLSWR